MSETQMNDKNKTEQPKKDRKEDEVTPSDPKLRKQPEVREPDAKRSEPMIKVQ